MIDPRMKRFRILKSHYRSSETGGPVAVYRIQELYRNLFGKLKWRAHVRRMEHYSQDVFFYTEKDACEYVANLREPLPEDELIG